VRTLAVVPARKGSRGLPGKNTRLFKGIPLVAHAIRIGLKTCDRVLVTTDDPLVAEIAQEYEVEVVNRPPELAQDDTPMLPVLQHALQASQYRPDLVVLLQPTSPLRKVRHVMDALKLIEETGADSVASVVEVPAHYSIYAQLCEDSCKPGAIKGAAGWELDEMPGTRQACAPTYVRDGSVYIFRAIRIEAGRLYGYDCRPVLLDPKESSTIDTAEDWRLAEMNA